MKFRNILQSESDYDAKILQHVQLNQFGNDQFNVFEEEMREYLKLKFYAKYQREIDQTSEDDIFLALYLFFSNYYRYSNKSIQLLLARYIYGEEIFNKIKSGKLLIRELDKVNIICDMIEDFYNYQVMYILGGGIGDE